MILSVFYLVASPPKGGFNHWAENPRMFLWFVTVSYKNLLNRYTRVFLLRLGEFNAKRVLSICHWTVLTKSWRGCDHKDRNTLIVLLSRRLLPPERSYLFIGLYPLKVEVPKTSRGRAVLVHWSILRVLIYERIASPFCVFILPRFVPFVK